ncbi:MAG: DUF3891 family protein [Deltaproteobacteria bacterium]|nr:DUF3891 family protein [Deltaproteobacteria bacterium]
MFKSKVRDLIIPQSEHARLAATLAFFWGNREFDRPPLPFETLLKAVALHDRAFGYLDSHAIGEMSDEVWIRLQRRGLEGGDGDLLCDTLIQLHIKRLAGHLKGPAGRKFREEIEKSVQKNLSTLSIDIERLERSDRVTAICDSIAFDFSFEEPVHSSSFVYPHNRSNGELEIEYQVHPGGEVQVSPWPFSVDIIKGFVLGYKPTSYPQLPDPVFVPYQVVPGMW